ncbi:AMP-binding protein [Thermogymnomonas acidicola]|uniref:AMP-binding protein n=1 Tax=Thermogymnomonas acidicola TaxID=399579 RepID=UPI0013969A88|nr:AMP-binding protein [Thermogymnomonas acidicola]
MLPRIQMEWPRFRKEHLEDIPQEYNWGGTDWIDRLGKEEPERVALIHTDGNAVAAFTFREISELSSAFARYLQDRGMGGRGGDRVMIMLGNQPCSGSPLWGGDKGRRCLCPPLPLH